MRATDSSYNEEGLSDHTAPLTKQWPPRRHRAHRNDRGGRRWRRSGRHSSPSQPPMKTQSTRYFYRSATTAPAHHIRPRRAIGRRRRRHRRSLQTCGGTADLGELKCKSGLARARSGPTLVGWPGKSSEPAVVNMEGRARVPETLNAAIVQFYLGVKQDRADLVRDFVATGKVDVNCVFKHNGYTALQMAVRDEHFNVFNALLDLGCNVNVVDSNGWTALAFCCHSGTSRLPFIEKLLAYGADPYIPSKLVGWTAMHVATSTRNEAALLALVRHGVDVNVTSSNLLTPLHIAIRSQWLKGAELLVKNMANAAVEDSDGYSALYYASVCFSEVGTRLRLLRLMLECGCDISKQLWIGRVADETAKPRFGIDQEILQWLQEQKAKKQPASLQSLCRTAVRRYLHPLADEKIGQLVSIVPDRLIEDLQLIKI
uniref:SOCS box domain-containing protein n=1 Tax=Plectus sambesii TaxID=2011161 RepID=A0A914UKX1_9BILA